MANVYKISGEKAIIQLLHNSRNLKENAKNIDYSLSKNNYHLFKNSDPDFINIRGRGITKSCEILRAMYADKLSKMKVNKKAGTRTMAEWVITAPTSLSADEERKFFHVAFSFVSNRYGPANIIGGSVHYDEPGARPHIHIDFIPAVPELAKDKSLTKKLQEERDSLLKELEKNPNITIGELRAKKEKIKLEFHDKIIKAPKTPTGRMKVAAREVITINDLRTFHPDFQKLCMKEFGRDIGVFTGVTRSRGGNKSRGAFLQERAERERDLIAQKAARYQNAVEHFRRVNAPGLSLDQFASQFSGPATPAHMVEEAKEAVMKMERKEASGRTREKEYSKGREIER